MSSKTICIFTQSPLINAPRVVKEANALNELGHHVTVLALWYDQNILERDLMLLDSRITYKAGIDLRNRRSLRVHYLRFKRRLFRELVKRFGIQSYHALGYGYKSYNRKLLSEKAEVYIGHEEMSMALAKDLIETGHHVAFDFEDWHSKDLLDKDRKYRPINLLEKLEAYLLQHSSFCYTTSESMAKAMARYYKVPMPKVIYNSFPSSERSTIDNLNLDRKSTEKPSVYWFSQVISPGRGLELLFDALPLTSTAFELHLRGKIHEDYRQILKDKLPLHVQLYIHHTVSASELISRTSEHSLGLAIEPNSPENKDLTISNKMFHYLQSGIPILATETAGQSEVAEKANGAVHIINHDASEMGRALENIMQDKNKSTAMKAASHYAGETFFSYELMKEELQLMINDVM